jgi:hypothetical protein
VRAHHGQAQRRLGGGRGQGRQATQGPAPPSPGAAGGAQRLRTGGLPALPPLQQRGVGAAWRDGGDAEGQAVGGTPGRQASADQPSRLTKLV